MKEVRRVTFSAVSALGVAGLGLCLEAKAVHRHIGKFLGYKVPAYRNNRQNHDDAEQEHKDGCQHRKYTTHAG